MNTMPVVPTEDPPDIHKPVRQQILPPCRVCGNKASGFHYGVNTCEGCKVRADGLFMLNSIEHEIYHAHEC